MKCNVRKVDPVTKTALNSYNSKMDRKNVYADYQDNPQLQKMLFADCLSQAQQAYQINSHSAT